MEYGGDATKHPQAVGRLMAPRDPSDPGPARVTRIAGVLLVIGILALVAVVVAAYVLGVRAQRSFDDVLAARDLSSTADVLRYSIQSAESSQRGYNLTGNQIYLAPYATARAEAVKRMADLRVAMADTETMTPAIDRLGALVGEKFAEMDRIIRLKRAGRDAEALEAVQTNRGKALMDEANVFLTRFVRLGDERLRLAADEQRRWLDILRYVDLVAAALIAVVVATVLRLFWAFAGSLARARNELQALNLGLEQRVEERTAELAAARDRAELLMAEVNHRVANSLALVASMVKLQARSAEPGPARDLLSEVHDRIFAVSLVHRRLYVSGDVRSVELGDYLASLLEQLEVTMRDAGHRCQLKHQLTPISLPTDKSVSLGVIAAELVTNAFKYAYPGQPGEVRVRLETDGASAQLVVEDDGIGRGASLAPRGTGLGTKLVSTMAASMGGRFEYVDRTPGTLARVSFPV